MIETIFSLNFFIAVLFFVALCGTFFTIIYFINNNRLLRKYFLNLVAETSDKPMEEPETEWQKRLIDSFIWKSYESASTEKLLNWIGITNIAQRLNRAGRHNRSEIVAFIAMKLFLLTLAVFALFFLFAFTNLGAQHPLTVFLVILSALLFAYFFPDLLLYAETQTYRKKLYEGLPVFTSLLSIAFNAGYSVDNSMKESALVMRKKFPRLSYEILLTCRQLAVSVDRDVAWESLIDRTNIVEMEMLVRNFQRNQRLGVGITSALDKQAKKVRRHQALEVDRKIERLPIWITVSVISFLLPVLILFMGALAYLNIMDALGQFMNMTA